MTDRQWAIIQPLLSPETEGPGRPPELELRQVVNAIFYVGRTGCQWQNLPKNYPNHHSVYYHYGKWRDNEALRQQERGRHGRAAEPSAAIIDSQSVKTTEAGGVSGYDAGKIVKGGNQPHTGVYVPTNEPSLSAPRDVRSSSCPRLLQRGLTTAAGMTIATPSPGLLVQRGRNKVIALYGIHRPS